MPPVQPDNPDSRPAGAPGGEARQVVTELRTELKSAVREVRTDLKAEIAVRADSLEKQIRLTWAFLTLQAVTLTAVLVRLFAG